jgi:hypothetical protein
LLINWYEDLFSLKEEKPLIPQIPKFAFSFYIRDEKYRELTCDLLNKFFYYFLSMHTNGEILCKLVEVRTAYELKESGKKRKRLYGIPRKSAEFFFSKL